MTVVEPESVRLKHIDKVRHRNGEHGPGYLERGPAVDLGVLRLRPGDATINHFHRNLEESFMVLEGRAEMWLDTERCIELEPGHFYRSAPGEMHYFRNHSTRIWRALFVKAPFDPADTNAVPWEPDEALNRLRERLSAHARRRR